MTNSLCNSRLHFISPSLPVRDVVGKDIQFLPGVSRAVKWNSKAYLTRERLTLTCSYIKNKGPLAFS